MALIVKESGGGRDFKPVPAGTHVAVCAMVVDIGLQPGFENGPPQRKVYIAWEIPSERAEWTDKDGNKNEGPMRIGKFYTLSLNEKATLRAHLENWRGRMFTAKELAGFDLFSILNKACLLGVTHKSVGDKIYANVSSVMGLPKGTAAPVAEKGLTAYPDENVKDALEKLPPWLQEKIANQLHAQERQSASKTGTDDASVVEGFSDEIPF